MLLRFRCKNFRSIRDEQELSLVAAKTRSAEKEESLLDTQIEGVKVLRCAAIYGANASGKSNVLRALRCFSAMVSESQRAWPPTGGVQTWDPYKLDDISRSAATTFEIDFVHRGRVFNYGFQFNQKMFLEEWLLDNTGKTKTLFRRITEESHPSTYRVSVDFPGKNLGTTAEQSRLLDTVESQTRPNSLFLSAAAQGNHRFLSDIFEWVIQRFYLLNPSHSFRKSYTAELCNNPERKRKVLGLLKAADIGIVDFKVAEEEVSEKVRQAVSAMAKILGDGAADGETAERLLSRHEITMLHEGTAESTYELPFDDESEGTRRYFQMLGPILSELQDGTLLLIDELESSLHPHLALQLVQMFNDPTLNPKGAQLIFATHDSNLLHANIMRRDQFWITEKTEAGSTVLNALSDFKARRDQNLELAYLSGRFGGVPFIDEGLIRSSISTSTEEVSSEDNLVEVNN